MTHQEIKSIGLIYKDKGWDGNQWYDHRDNRSSYQFLKEFRQTFHFSNNPQTASQVKSFKEAMQNAPNGTYFYHEKESYVPYRINHGHVIFNRGDAIDINQIRNNLNQHRNINTNKHRSIS